MLRTVEIIAGRDLVKGEEVTLNYLGPTSILMSREERQAQLSKGWFFTCSCNICSLQGEDLQINQDIRSTLANFKEQLLSIPKSPKDYMKSKGEASHAWTEENNKSAMLGGISLQVVRALGPDCVPMLREELEGLYFSIRKNMADISLHM